MGSAFSGAIDMADTKVENETNELITLDGNEYLYAVDDPSGTPTPSKVAGGMLGSPSLKGNRDWGCVFVSGYANTALQFHPGNAQYTAIGSTAGSNGLGTGNERSRRKRVPHTTGASAGSSAGTRSSAIGFYRGNASGRGGFRFVFRFAMNTLPASWRAFVGINALFANPSNADPSAMVNMFGLGKDAADTAWQIMTNDGSGTATKTALNTTDFPISDTTSVFELEFYCPPGTAPSITYRVSRITGVDANSKDTYATGAVTGTISSDLPAVDTNLGWLMWINNDVNASAAIIDIIKCYWETTGGVG